MFNRPISMDYILYTYYQIEDYHFEMFLQYSLEPLDIQVEVLKIKAGVQFLMKQSARLVTMLQESVI